ncbi:MAG: phosphoglycolate phosphatase [Proteobacteria bacterium SG_bin9]|nr:MAG: phosphoglycolate phosphatase [Proteobacteria bacterium SG_bin9]
MPSPPLVVFDLDGTLVDTAPDLVGALNAILERNGIPPVPPQAARKLIGAGARALLERGLERDGRAVDADTLNRMVQDFIAYYADNIAVRSKPFDGLIAALDILAERGCRFAVCTNKLEWLSKRLLDELDLSKRFAAICGADTFGVSKPDPTILRQTVARAGGDMSSTIMVGDAGPDVGVARRAGVPVIGVDYGYTEVPIRDLSPDIVISHLNELPSAVQLAQARRGAG